jgi:hypothetical protein
MAGMDRPYRCPFCRWSRLPDPSKGAPPFRPDAALAELAEHLRAAHRPDWDRLVLAVHGPIVVGPSGPDADYLGMEP